MEDQDKNITKSYGGFDSILSAVSLIRVDQANNDLDSRYSWETVSFHNSGETYPLSTPQKEKGENTAFSTPQKSAIRVKTVPDLNGFENMSLNEGVQKTTPPQESFEETSRTNELDCDTFFNWPYPGDSSPPIQSPMISEPTETADKNGFYCDPFHNGSHQDIEMPSFSETPKVEMFSLASPPHQEDIAKDSLVFLSSLRQDKISEIPGIYRPDTNDFENVPNQIEIQQEILMNPLASDSSTNSEQETSQQEDTQKSTDISGSEASNYGSEPNPGLMLSPSSQEDIPDIYPSLVQPPREKVFESPLEVDNGSYENQFQTNNEMLMTKKKLDDKIFYILRDNGSVHKGHLLKFRKSENTEMPNEFYVRYNDLDNKMDAWVGEDRISDTPEGLGGYQGGREGNKLTDEEKKNKKSQPIRNIEKVQFGRYEIDTWYHSPYPYEYGEVPILYVCEFCLKYMRLRESYAYHLHDCKQRQPPGSLVYRNDNIFIFEVDGDKEKLYCQCLSLLSKLFLEYKNLIYDPCPFKFYVMCVKDQDGHHMVGYFAKEKESEMNYNLNCLLVWPPFQRKGYGKLLIALSYEISRKEGLIGGPEKPLSALGRLSYRGFWGYTLLEKLKNLRTKQVTIKKLSQLTYIAEEDIAYTLEAVKLMNYFKGDHIICTNRHIIEARLSLPQMRKPKLVINRKGLSWKV